MHCLSCHRHPRECWICPCLGLEIALSRGKLAVAAWWRRCGYRTFLRGRDLEVRER